MLAWSVIFSGKVFEKINRIASYQEIKKSDKICAGGDDSQRDQGKDQEIDCWSSLRQYVKVQGSRFSNRRSKRKKFRERDDVPQRSWDREGCVKPSEIF